MNESVQIALITFLGTALASILVAGPLWLRAKAEERRTNVDTEIAARGAADQFNNSNWERVEKERERNDSREIARDKQIDALRAELLLERSQRYQEQNQNSAILAEERNQRRILASQINDERTNRSQEVAAVRGLSEETITKLTKQIVDLEEAIRGLEKTIAELNLATADLQERLKQEQVLRLAAEKRVDELEARIVKLLEAQAPKGTEAQ